MIEIAGLVKCYGAKTALGGISFTVKSGEIVGLLGLNGAGKSTTMNIMAGCLSPTQGTVRIDGLDIAKEPLGAKRKIGYLPELPPLYVDMTVQKYLEFVLALKKVRLPQKEHLTAVCERAGVIDVRGRLIRNLSKGYRQRVGLAQALIGDPPILILDEPTVGLDPTQIIEMRSLIAEMGRERTVILSSHILSEIQAVCGRVVVIDHGKLVADDATAALKAGRGDRCVVTTAAGEQTNSDTVLTALLAVPGVESAAVKTFSSDTHEADYEVCSADGADIRAAVSFALAAAGIPLVGLRSAQPTLEEIFLRLVSAGESAGGEGA